MVPNARAGTLSILVAGGKRALDRYASILLTIGCTTFYLGDLGNGCILKLINKLIVCAVRQLVQVGAALSAQAGMDSQTLFNAMNVSSASRFVQDLPELIDHEFEGDSFTFELAAKDVGFRVQAARDLGVPLSIASVIEQNRIRGQARESPRKARKRRRSSSRRQWGPRSDLLTIDR